VTLIKELNMESFDGEVLGNKPLPHHDFL